MILLDKKTQKPVSAFFYLDFLNRKAYNIDKIYYDVYYIKKISYEHLRKKIRGGRVDSHGDHRIAMTLAIAALIAEGPVTIEGAECVAKSFPDFFERLDALRIR